MNICRFVQKWLLKGQDIFFYSLLYKCLNMHIRNCSRCRDFKESYDAFYRLKKKDIDIDGVSPSAELRETCLHHATQKQYELKKTYRRRVRSFRFAMVFLILFVFTLPFLEDLMREEQVYYAEQEIEETLDQQYDEDFTTELTYVFHLISYVDEEEEIR